MNIANIPISACQAISRHQSLKLNLEDSETFVQTILNSREPNARLKAAALRHQQVLRG
ncbi:MAG: DUF1778 domain-containing protein [Pseudanabaena sp. Salubria-1]|nr:DUF1778 domain-containing protein [Pseudanabaena sp. Salubria-1]